MTRLTELTGSRLGRLLVLKRGEDLVQGNGRKRAQWDCVCDCGHTVTVEAGNLKSGHTTSCGCASVENCAKVGSQHYTHRMSRTREWWVWLGMRQRCSNPKSQGYPDYGGRGVSVCDRWDASFSDFISDMGPCPPGLTLEREDVNGNYQPENCVWATRKAQARNRRVNVWVTHQGRQMCMAECAEIESIPYGLFIDRFRRQGWTLKRTITTPVRSKNDTTKSCN